MQNINPIFYYVLQLRRNTTRRREQVSETTMEKRRNKIKQITQLRVSWNYPLKKAAILDLITFDYSRMLIVWGVSDELSREEVIPKLHSLGKLISIQDRWSKKGDGTEIWKGVIAAFGSTREAVYASAEIPKIVK